MFKKMLTAILFVVVLAIANSAEALDCEAWFQAYAGRDDPAYAANAAILRERTCTKTCPQTTNTCSVDSTQPEISFGCLRIGPAAVFYGETTRECFFEWIFPRPKCGTTKNMCEVGTVTGRPTPDKVTPTLDQWECKNSQGYKVGCSLSQSDGSTTISTDDGAYGSPGGENMGDENMGDENMGDENMGDENMGDENMGDDNGPIVDPVVDPPSDPPVNPGNSGNTGGGRTTRGGGGGSVGSSDDTAPEHTGYLEIPGDDSYQSGVGMVSGWLCDADRVFIQFDDDPQKRFEASYGTERRDTQEACGDTDNSFGMVFNWNLLGDGEHSIAVYVNSEQEAWKTATFTVTTLGVEFLRDAADATCTVPDWPSPGEDVTMQWQQPLQNYVINAGRGGRGGGSGGSVGSSGSAAPEHTGYLGIPGDNSYQSGIGMVSGWLCDADRVFIQFDDDQKKYEASYGTERLDTQEACGDTDNSFGMVFNWNLLGDGEHTISVYVDREQEAWKTATFTVTTLGVEFLRDAADAKCTVSDWPSPGEDVTMQWQQPLQNYVIVEGK